METETKHEMKESGKRDKVETEKNRKGNGNRKTTEKEIFQK